MMGITVLHVGFEYQCSWDITVFDGRCLQALLQTADEFTIENINPTEPSRRERDVYGISEATMRASEPFLWNALDALSCTTDGRPDNDVSSHYRAIAQQNGLLAKLELMVSCAEFEVILSFMIVIPC